MRFAIVDIETTGGNQAGEKITEIAIYIHDGLKVIDFFHSLVNPEKDIPWNITRITGITNSMVANAPKFYEIAKRIVEITEGCVFVAHNVAFDFPFVRREFANLGFEYQKDVLCTVKLSRQIIPGHTSYSLGKLCEALNIRISGRHRAAGDAEATAKLFELLVKTNAQEIAKSISPLKVSTKRSYDENLVKDLPQACGVYYFFNADNVLIYVGKSINIKKRVISHLQKNDIKRSLNIQSELAYIKFELTGSELVALLLESDEIKQLKPKYNKAQRKSKFNFGLYLKEIEKNYTLLSIEPVTSFSSPILTYYSSQEGKEHLFKLVEKYNLCQKLAGLQNTQNSCFGHQINQCKGACIGLENLSEYNARITQLVNELTFNNETFLVVDKGRKSNERSVVYVSKGNYYGFGFIDTVLGTKKEVLLSCIKPYKNNKNTHQILQLFLRKNPEIQIIKV